jgi:hypothetical protein
MVMMTITLSGVWYGWLRLRFAQYGRLACPTARSTTSAETVGGVALATSPAAMAYTTIETGLITLIIVLGLAVYLLSRRAADLNPHGSSSEGFKLR